MLLLIITSTLNEGKSLMGRVGVVKQTFSNANKLISRRLTGKPRLSICNSAKVNVQNFQTKHYNGTNRWNTCAMVANNQRPIVKVTRTIIVKATGRNRLERVRVQEKTVRSASRIVDLRDGRRLVAATLHGNGSVQFVEVAQCRDMWSPPHGAFEAAAFIGNGHFVRAQNSLPSDVVRQMSRWNTSGVGHQQDDKQRFYRAWHFSALAVLIVSPHVIRKVDAFAEEWIYNRLRNIDRSFSRKCERLGNRFTCIVPRSFTCLANSTHNGKAGNRFLRRNWRMWHLHFPCKRRAFFVMI